MTEGTTVDEFEKLRRLTAENPADFADEKPSGLEVEVLRRKFGGAIVCVEDTDGTKVETPVAVAIRIPTKSSEPPYTLVDFADGTSIVLGPPDDKENLKYLALSRGGTTMKLQGGNPDLERSERVATAIRLNPAGFNATVRYDPRNGEEDKEQISKLRKMTLQELSARKDELGAEIRAVTGINQPDRGVPRTPTKLQKPETAAKTTTAVGTLVRPK